MFQFLGWQKTDLDLKGWITIKLVRRTRFLTVQQLAGILHVSHPAVVQLTNQLSESGYIESRKAERDKRNTYLSLTEKGEKVYESLDSVMTDAENLLSGILSDTGYDINDVVVRLEKVLSQKKLYNLAIGAVKSKQINEIRIVPFEKKYKNYFKELNIEWLKKYFTFEPADAKMLSNPEKEIINKGGEIFFALLDNEIVGTCAVLKIDNRTFELAKMAVTERAQGRQVGKKLGLTAIGFAVSRNAEKIILDTNSKLDTAVNLYRNLGFMVVQHKYDDKYKRDLFRMELKLKE
jgi:DNA-binding MarR family transcriptional regulator/ribosomal protein S18 acetylase RimI-like enzyme